MGENTTMQNIKTNQYFSKINSVFRERRLLFVLAQKAELNHYTLESEKATPELVDLVNFKLDRLHTYFEEIKATIRKILEKVEKENDTSEYSHFLTRIKILIGKPISQTEIQNFIQTTLLRQNDFTNLKEEIPLETAIDQNKIIETLATLIKNIKPDHQLILKKLELIIPHEFSLPEKLPKDIKSKKDILTFYLEKGFNIHDFQHHFSNAATCIPFEIHQIIQKAITEQLFKLKSFIEEHYFKQSSILSGEIQPNQLPDIDTYCPQCDYSKKIAEISKFVKETLLTNLGIFNTHSLETVKTRLNEHLKQIDDFDNPEAQRITIEARQKTLPILEKIIQEKDQAEIYDGFKEILAIKLTQTDLNSRKNQERMIAQTLLLLKKKGVSKILLYLNENETNKLIQKLRRLAKEIQEPSIQNEVAPFISTLEKEISRITT